MWPSDLEKLKAFAFFSRDLEKKVILRLKTRKTKYSQPHTPPLITFRHALKSAFFPGMPGSALSVAKEEIFLYYY
jgi:hypothetical protein